MIKGKILSFVLIIFVLSSIFIFYFVNDAMSGPSFLDNTKLSEFDKLELDTIYKEYPETISFGNLLDVKYLNYNSVFKLDCEFAFVFKNDKPKRMNNLIIRYNSLIDGQEKENEYIINYYDSYDFYDNVNYKNKGKTRLHRYTLFNLFDLDSYVEKMEHGKDLNYYSEFIKKFGYIDVDKINFVFNFSDGTSEEHCVIADKDKILDMKSYELDDDANEIIKKYKEPESFIEGYYEENGDLNKLIINLEKQYIVFPEVGLNDIYNFFDIITISENKKKIIENEYVLNVFRSTTMEEFTSEELKKIMLYIKKIYTECNFNLDSLGYSNFYEIVKKINNVYEEKTGNILVSKDFGYYEVDEVFKKLK